MSATDLADEYDDDYDEDEDEDDDGDDSRAISLGFFNVENLESWLISL